MDNFNEKYVSSTDKIERVECVFPLEEIIRKFKCNTNNQFCLGEYWISEEELHVVLTREPE